MSTALGGRSKADGQFSTAVGWANTASGVNSFAGGNKSVANGASSVALGDVAVATGDNSVAIGHGASAQAANSVALGSGSVTTDPDTVSVGSDTVQRRITNVAAGTGVNDVATFGQLQSGLASISQRVDAINRDADAGTAAALAAASLPQAFTPGKGMVGIAVGNWRSETAFAVGASKVFETGLAFKASASFDGRGSNGVAAGVGWQF
jgi:autotransporter adhesin